MTTTVTKIKHFENSFEVLNQSGIEIDLDSILVKEYQQEGLPSDINHPM
ncbi:MAG: hypothetical protein QNJ55_03275 [Xenococcus sp. MO_188.B8]|nr:hypothetical protein [Xenococcus sp. MO_188.B8]